VKSGVTTRWRLLSIVALAVFLPGSNGQEISKGQATTKAAAKLDPAVVRKLIADLDSPDFKTRDKATQELSHLPEVPDALRDAAKSENGEVRRRAQTALDRITLRLEETAYQALIADLHKIEIDRFVRRMVTDEKFARDAQWKVIETIAKAVTKRANELAGQKFPVPEIDTLSLPLADLTRERVSLSQKRVLLQQREPRFTSWQNCVILCTGPTPRTTGLSNSILIVDGDFTGATVVDHSLVIVRGNVGRLNGLRRSIIIATGNFAGATSCDHSFLEVNNQRIRFTRSGESVLVKTALKTTGPTSSRIIDTEKGPLQLLNFSKRKTDAQLAWGKEVNGLAVAITPADHQDKVLVRWKNVGKDLLEFPCNRFHSDTVHTHADDLLGHVFLKGPDGKLAPARQYEAPRVGGPALRMNNVVLGPGQTHEEIIDLWAYVEKPMAAGRYQLSIDLDPAHGHRLEWEARFWSGRIESNTLEIMLGK
jgi:hypothetical protein